MGGQDHGRSLDGSPFRRPSHRRPDRSRPSRATFCSRPRSIAPKPAMPTPSPTPIGRARRDPALPWPRRQGAGNRRRARDPARAHRLRGHARLDRRAVARHERRYVCVAATHTVMACREDPELRAAVLAGDLTVPDGQPLVWAMNAFGAELQDRVYGPELMARACERAARTGTRMFLYGGRNQGALVQLAYNLRTRYPGLQIVGGHAPPYRSLSSAEEDDIARRDRPLARRRGLGGHRRPQAGEVDGRHALPPPGARPRRRRRRLRLPRRARAPGAGLDAGVGPRVALPARRRAAPPGPALPALQPALRDRLHPAMGGPPAGAAPHAANLPRAPWTRSSTSPSSDAAASGCRWPCPSPTAACGCWASRRTPSAWRPCAPGGCRSRSPAPPRC